MSSLPSGVRFSDEKTLKQRIHYNKWEREEKWVVRGSGTSPLKLRKQSTYSEDHYPAEGGSGNGNLGGRLHQEE